VLSYELSLHEQRVVVDSGVSTYEPGPDRSSERSTAAHNTIRIDDEEQAEIWESFRVGRRPHVGQISGGTIGAFSFVSGEHAAYQRFGVAHARKILWQAPDTWIVADLLKGSGSHRAESFLHFHPQVHLEALPDLLKTDAGLPIHRWTVNFAGHSYCLVTFGPGQFNLIEGWYSAQFGKPQSSSIVRWAWEGQIPAGFVYIFTAVAVPSPYIVADWPGEWIEIDNQRIPLR
jgi:hypothetical protein